MTSKIPPKTYLSSKEITASLSRHGAVANNRPSVQKPVTTLSGTGEVATDHHRLIANADTKSKVFGAQSDAFIAGKARVLQSNNPYNRKQKDALSQD